MSNVEEEFPERTRGRNLRGTHPHLDTGSVFHVSLGRYTFMDKLIMIQLHFQISPLHQ